MGLSFAVIMDPIEKIDIRADSTFAIMRESQKRGHALFYALQDGLEQRGDGVFLHARPVRVRDEQGDHFELSEPLCLDLNHDVDAIFIRPDPPVDIEYLLTTLILDRVDRGRVVFVNDPQALRDANEKLFALHFPHLTPKTMVSRSPARIRAFLAEEGDLVVKPLMNAGGLGVLQLRQGDKNVGSILELLTDNGRRAIEAQKFLPGVVDGDRRIILVGGRPAGVINRRPKDDDLRSNMHVGGVAEAAQLNERDLEICKELEPVLVKMGLPFVGIDVISGFLTEINVTSPTGLQEIDRFDGVCLEGELIDWVEARSRALTQSG